MFNQQHEDNSEIILFKRKTVGYGYFLQFIFKNMYLKFLTLGQMNLVRDFAFLAIFILTSHFNIHWIFKFSKYFNILSFETYIL